MATAGKVARLNPLHVCPLTDLACLERDGWELDDAELIAQAHPTTFWMPDRHLRETLPVGALVKLVFRIRTVDKTGQEDINVERMWVTVDGRAGTVYQGTLDNDPLCTQDMRAGMALHFEARHVIGIWDEAA